MMNIEKAASSRRNILKSIGLLTTAVASTTSLNVLATSEKKHDHHAHAADAKTQRVIKTASDCIIKGEVCNQHCIELVKAGDSSIADCMHTVTEMLAMCTALSKMAVYNSKHLNALMKVCINVCEDCENECRKHENKHVECKACANACADCIKACEAYLA